MQKNLISLGLMSGTSGDGVDASIIKSNGIDKFESITDKYFEYDSGTYQDIHNLKEKIHDVDTLKDYKTEVDNLERKITIFHSKIVKELNVSDQTIIGFHGQTIFHNPKEKISKQLGNGKLLNQLTNKKIVYNFRNNDISDGGQGAPLAPVFHHLLVIQNNIRLPVCILNIGGISNITIIKDKDNLEELISKDIGPGNCLIDSWVRNNSEKKFDLNGFLASSGNKNEIIFEQAQELYMNRNNKKKLSLDTSDFDISFARGLNLEDGAATLTDFTASIIGEELSLSLKKFKEIKNILICGGGRKNKTLIDKIKENISPKINLELIDKYKIDGDFIESQAFAFLAIRSILKFPISYPGTTGCNFPSKGGEIIEN